MKSHSRFTLAACLSALALSGCASTGAQSDSSAIADSGAVMGYRISNWSAVNDHTLIVEANDGTRYKANLMGNCQGLGMADRLGFANRGGFQQIDRFSSIVLPDGTRCSFQSFNQIATPASQALNRYESLGNAAKPASELAAPR